jgi:hypothetical protein
MLHLSKRGTDSWIVSTICEDPEHPSGACYRSLQILELLEEAGFHLCPIEAPPRPSRWRVARNGVSCGLRDGFYRPVHLDGIRVAGAQAAAYATLLLDYPSARGLLIEGTGFGALTAVAWCRRHGLRTVLVPANIEALVDYPHAGTHRGLSPLQRFAHEARWLRLADAIFTISIEEAWWLELNGISSDHLPYYPPRLRLKHLQALRDSRCPDPSFGYLLLADFRNVPNRKGAELLMQLLRGAQPLPASVHVVGRGMDHVAEIFSSDRRFVVHGEVNDHQLADFQRRCLAQILVHPASSGMLTRVVDASIAGIPIIGNWMGLKSYHHFFERSLIGSGVFTADPAVRFAPEKPQQAAAALIRALES